MTKGRVGANDIRARAVHHRNRPEPRMKMPDSSHQTDDAQDSAGACHEI